MPDQLSDALWAVKEAASEFLQKEIAPRTVQLREGASETKLAAEIRAASKAAGFFTKTQPEDFGGSPASVLELTVLRDAILTPRKPGIHRLAVHP